MPLRHTGTQLLCPACGVALGCLWVPSALLLCYTALQPYALQRRCVKNKNKKTGVSILYGGVLPGDRRRIEFPMKKKYLEPYVLISGNDRYRQIRILRI